MSLAHCIMQVELREVLLSKKPTAMLSASAKGTVPVLVLEDATVLDESLDIMRWAINLTYPDVNDPFNWLVGDAPLLADRLIKTTLTPPRFIFNFNETHSYIHTRRHTRPRPYCVIEPLVHTS